jgi:hypothetical protein
MGACGHVHAVMCMRSCACGHVHAVCLDAGLAALRNRCGTLQAAILNGIAGNIWVEVLFVLV